MSKSRRSNPFSYNLLEFKEGDNVKKLLKENRRRCKHIFSSLMRRLKSAYRNLHARKEFEGSPVFLNMRDLAVQNENELNNNYNECLLEMCDPSEWRYHREGNDMIFITVEKIHSAQNLIYRSSREIWTYEKHAYHPYGAVGVIRQHREMHKDAVYLQATHRKEAIDKARFAYKYICAALKLIKQQYPYIREKYKPRLLKIVREKAIGQTRKVQLQELIAAGIPASDAVGPWWPRTPKIKSPMDFINVAEGDLSDAYSDLLSPTLQDWLTNIGLDADDRQLAGAVQHYYDRNKTIPSVKWAQERSNQLEDDRRKKEIEGQVPSVKLWLGYSEAWLEKGKIQIPILLGPEWKVLGPNDAKKLCETAKRDGLCVLDVITSFVEGDDYDSDQQEEAAEMRKHDPRTSPYSNAMLKYCDEAGVCSLILCTDPKRRTVVGLDADGVCTVDHHCTGIQNKVDAEAWEYFKKH
jgi:hypothetical protein